MGKAGVTAKVLNGISTLIDRGQICVILGPSGSGKSTLLNAIGGLDTVDSGQIHIDGKEITSLKPGKAVRLPPGYPGVCIPIL